MSRLLLTACEHDRDRPMKYFGAKEGKMRVCATRKPAQLPYVIIHTWRADSYTYIGMRDVMWDEQEVCWPHDTYTRRTRIMSIL